MFQEPKIREFLMTTLHHLRCDRPTILRELDHDLMLCFHHCCCLEDLQQLCQILLKDLFIVIEKGFFGLANLFPFSMVVQFTQL